MGKEEFEEIVIKAKEYIAAGDIYQVNLSQRFQAEINEDPFTIYQRLRKINPSPFSFFLLFPFFPLRHRPNAGCSGRLHRASPADKSKRRKSRADRKLNHGNGTQEDLILAC